MAFADLTWRTFRPAEGFYTSEVEAPRPLPVRTFLPTGYEPKYPYPLLVFFHGHGGNEEQSVRLAPRLSRAITFASACAARRPSAFAPMDAPVTAGAPKDSSTRCWKSMSFAPSSRHAASITSTPSASTWPGCAREPASPTAWA